jgi:hypothetical protein
MWASNIVFLMTLTFTCCWCGVLLKRSSIISTLAEQKLFQFSQYKMFIFSFFPLINNDLIFSFREAPPN